MASLCAATATATVGPPRLMVALHLPSCRALKLPPKLLRTPSTSRLKKVLKSQVRQRLFTVFASNSNPCGGDLIKDEPDTSDTAQGPPLLTILAGFLVFLLVCWVLGSIIMWLFGLIVTVPPPK